MKKSNPTSLFRYVSAALLAAFLLLPLFTISAHALSPYSYNMSSDYKNSPYYDNLKSLELTGNGAADVLMVAMSQLGYHEGNGTSDFAGQNNTGSKNFVEYNRLYGKLDNKEGNGYSYGYAWCASFVNWCLRQARIDREIAGGEVSCTRWVRDFLKPEGLWEASLAYGGSYDPKPGDLIFFQKAGSSSLSTHVGLVRYSDGTYVHTVEGNTSSGSVALDAYLLSDSYIIGYGTPDYESDGSAVCDYSKSGEARGLYIVTAEGLNIREQATTGSKIVGGLKKADLVEVEAFESGYARITTAGGASGYSSRYYLELVTSLPPRLYTVTFLGRDDTEVLAEIICEEGAIPTPPAVEGFEEDGQRYTFVGWSQEIVPATKHTVYKAVYTVSDPSEEDAEAPDESGADTAPPSSDGSVPPSDGTSSTDALQNESTADASEADAGGGATVPISALALCALLPAFTIAFVRRKPE